MRPELESVLQCLILNGYSVFSLINDILVHGRNLEDQRITLLREGVERDAADICAHLLNHNSSSVSVIVRALSVAQPMRRSEVEFENHRHGVIINMLPDNVFLEIYNFCLRDPTKYPLQKQWQRLVRVCQRWRRIIFASPRRLDLRLTCTHGTPVAQNLAYWPVTLPLTIDYPRLWRSDYRFSHAPDDNIVAALQHASRIHRVEICTTYSLLSKVATVMQEPFPALTYLELTWDLAGLPGIFPVLPGGFLGGSAPRLRHLHLGGIFFPELPTLLLISS
ncbi:hypothetical protein EDB85DRAFT_2143656 [Lactarius pseudohatsudake]|nr:hypothetical protein EDB85DRAFT_2143656 [Lactarius pseudohatsudake]